MSHSIWFILLYVKHYHCAEQRDKKAKNHTEKKKVLYMPN